MPTPIISALVYTVTDTTIVATWTTDISADSNLFAGAKAAIDNGVAASGTSHQCVVTGLTPNTVYSCHVVSGATTGSSSNVTTNPRQNRIAPISATNVFVNSNGCQGDTLRSFVSNDNNSYMTTDDSTGLVSGTPNAGYNTQLALLTDENAFYGSFVSLANYGTPGNTSIGTDGPSSGPLTNKSTGLIGLNGNLHMFVYRQDPPTYASNRYANWIKSTNHGATWNNFTDKTTFTAGGNIVQPYSPSEPVQFYDKFVGLISPVLYAADDGTLGYNTAGNQIDGGNAYIYMNFAKDAATSTQYLTRIPRIQFDAQNASAIQYWVGPSTPTVADFTNDANWSNTEGSETAIIASGAPYWAQIYFVPKLNSYVMYGHTSGGGHNILLCYSAPTPAGPWTLLLSQSQASTGEAYGFFAFHRDVISNTAIDNVTFRLNQTRTDNYEPSWSNFTLQTTSTPAPTIVQSKGGTTVQGVNPAPIAFTSPVTMGNLLVVAWGRTQADGTVSSVTDTLNNSYTIVYDTNDTGAFGGGWAYTVSKASGANTVSLHGSTNIWPSVIEVNVNAVRAVSTPKVSSANPANSNTISVHAGDTLLGFVEVYNANNYTANYGFTLLTQYGYSSPYVAATSYELSANANVFALNAQIASFSLSGSNAPSVAGVGAFYQTSFSISGNAGVAGATVSYSGTASGSVVADASGNYTIPLLFAGNYTITPSLAGYNFSPANSSQTIVAANLTGVNFTATTHAISGNAGVAGATVTLSGDASAVTTADGSGNYTFSTLANGNYVVTPSLAGYTFSPASASEVVSGADITGVNFTATLVPSGGPVTPGCNAPGAYGGQSLATAFQNPQHLDLIQVVNEGGDVVWNLTYNGVANTNPVSATATALLGRYEGQNFAQAFPNANQYNIFQIVSQGSKVVFYVDYQGNSVTP